jgi:hypothetical protein
MNYNLEEDPIAEVHRIRAELLEKYGGLDGWHKHNLEERPLLEKKGWRFATEDELQGRWK